MELKLKGNIEHFYRDMQKIRMGQEKLDKGPGAGKSDVSLVEYLSAARPEGCGKDGLFDVQHLYNELGVNPHTMTVSQLINLDQDSRWLVPEIFRDAIRKGLRTSPFYNSLIADSQDVAQPQVNMPYIDLSDAEPQTTLEAESISTGTISYGNKTIELSKQALGVQLSYEAIQYTKVSLLTIFLQDVGIKLGQKLNNTFVDIAINGDQDDGSEAAAVIGVDNTTTKLLYKDILTAWIRGSRLGRIYDSMIAGEAMANKILNLTEFKDKQAGTPQQSIVVNETLPSQSRIYVSAQVPANQVILLDKRFAIAQMTAAPLLVEGDKIVNKQIEASYASITTGFGNIFRDARVIIDESLALSGNDFPSYMTPTL